MARESRKAAQGGQFSAATIKKVMSEAGPTVKMVKLNDDGTAEEHSLDMTASANSVSKLLGGSLTFVGPWKPIECVVMALRDQKPKKMKKNAHSLQPPMHEEVVYGPMAVLRVRGEDSEPADFTLAEYKAWQEKTIKPEDVVDSSGGEEEEDEAEDSDDNSPAVEGESDSDDEGIELDPANPEQCTERAIELAMAEAAGALEDDSEVSTEELFATEEFRASVLKHYAELSTTALDAEQTAAVEARLKEVAAEVAAMSDDEEDEEEFDPENPVHCREKGLELAMHEFAQRPTVELVSSADFRKSVLKHYAEVTEAEGALDAEQTAAIDARLKELAEQMAELSSSDEEGSSDDDDSEAEGDAPAAAEEAKEEPPTAKASVKKHKNEEEGAPKAKKQRTKKG